MSGCFIQSWEEAAGKPILGLKHTQSENSAMPQSQRLISVDRVLSSSHMKTAPCGLQPGGQPCRIDASLLPPLQGRCQQTASPSSSPSCCCCWELIGAQVCTFVSFFSSFQQLLPRSALHVLLVPVMGLKLHFCTVAAVTLKPRIPEK